MLQGDVAGIVLQNLSTLAVGYGIAFAYDWRMALLITGILPLVIMSTVIHMKFVMGSSSDSDKVGTRQALGACLVGFLS